ncbi:MAG: type I methionyl aminopeptidase [Elusimicrobiota bacterium]
MQKHRSLGNTRKMINVYDSEDIEIIRITGKKIAAVCAALKSEVVDGNNAKRVDDLAAKMIRDDECTPAFLGYRGYPATVCVSINSEVVHGIPTENKVFRAGDVVSVDVGLFYRGFCGDMAFTVGVGQVDAKVANLMDAGRKALDAAISASIAGNHVGDISAAIQKCAEKHGFSVVRDYAGHGVGHRMHEDPQIPNVGFPGTGPELVPGMVLALETMLNLGGWAVKTLSDGWTVVTVDGKKAVHFEDMVVITPSAAEVVTRG